MSVLYESWNECEGNWKKSGLYLSAVSTERSKRRGVRVWKTKAELVERFGQAGAESIITRKMGGEDLRSKETREHPEAPGCPDLRQFLVLDSEKVIEEEEEVISRLFKAADEETEESYDDSGDADSQTSDSDSSASKVKGKKAKASKKRKSDKKEEKNKKKKVKKQQDKKKGKGKVATGKNAKKGKDNKKEKKAKKETKEKKEKTAKGKDDESGSESVDLEAEEKEKKRELLKKAKKAH